MGVFRFFFLFCITVRSQIKLKVLTLLSLLSHHLVPVFSVSKHQLIVNMINTRLPPSTFLPSVCPGNTAEEPCLLPGNSHRHDNHTTSRTEKMLIVATVAVGQANSPAPPRGQVAASTPPFHKCAQTRLHVWVWQQLHLEKPPAPQSPGSEMRLESCGSEARTGARRTGSMSSSRDL